MSKKRNALIGVMTMALLSVSGPAAAGNDPASDYARGICLQYGWRTLGYPDYLDCYYYYYSIYGTPDQVDDPFHVD